MKKLLLKTKYYGENIHDLLEDIEYSVMDPNLNGIPTDSGNIMKGEFTITVEWNDEE